MHTGSKILQTCQASTADLFAVECGQIAVGIAEAAAATSAIHTLAMAELACIAGGIAAVFFLPKMKE